MNFRKENDTATEIREGPYFCMLKTCISVREMTQKFMALRVSAEMWKTSVSVREMKPPQKFMRDNIAFWLERFFLFDRRKKSGPSNWKAFSGARSKRRQANKGW